MGQSVIREPATATRSRDTRAATAAVLACFEKVVVASYANRGTDGGEPVRLAAETLDRLARLSIGRDERPFGLLFTDTRLRHRFDEEAAMLHILSPVARLLGDLWLADRLGFCDVTFGVARLQATLRQMPRPDAAPPIKPGRRIAIWTIPGDQHRFGAAMLRAMFARRGWNVGSIKVDGAAAIGEALRRQPAAVVGLSIGNERRIPLLVACAEAARREGARVMIGGSLVARRPDLGALAGADALVAGARDAAREAERLLAPPAGPGDCAHLQTRIAAGWLG